MGLETGIHDRWILTNSGWRVLLGRGLDIFQPGSRHPLELEGQLQQYRQVKAFGVTYIREPEQAGQNK